MPPPFTDIQRTPELPRQPEDGPPGQQAADNTKKGLSVRERNPHGFFGRPMTHPGKPGRSNRRRYAIGGVLKQG